jgi:hypothetical protein
MKRIFRSFSVALLIGAMLAVSAWADSQARIVRLSDVQGDVKIDRAAGEGFQKAFLNMPITQGTQLRTGGDGRAEVEFENGSVIHLTPDTLLQFTELGLQDSGTRISTIHLQNGEAYFNFDDNKSDQFTVTFLEQKAPVTEPAHFRVDVDGKAASLAVFKGKVGVNGPNDKLEVGKKQTANFEPGVQQASLSKNVEQDPFDEWDKKQSEYHQRYLTSSSNVGSGFGASDLGYYGNFMTVPGYGMMWRPYFAGAGWDPFMDGAWMWYPGFGYTWVSAYPWGWLPYHYGGWSFVPGYGWMWGPGTSLVAFQPVAPIIRPPANYVPPRPPAATARNTVVVGRGLTASSALTAAPGGSKMLVKGNAAGIGVPRGVSNLAKINDKVAQKGSAKVPTNTRITTAGAAPIITGNIRGTAPGHAGTAARAGSRVASTSGGRANAGGGRMSTGGGRMSTGGSMGGHSSSSGSHSSAPHH